jgi:hypothetical protein
MVRQVQVWKTVDYFLCPLGSTQNGLFNLKFKTNVALIVLDFVGSFDSCVSNFHNEYPIDCCTFFFKTAKATLLQSCSHWI